MGAIPVQGTDSNNVGEFLAFCGECADLSFLVAIGADVYAQVLIGVRAGMDGEGGGQVSGVIDNLHGEVEFGRRLVSGLSILAASPYEGYRGTFGDFEATSCGIEELLPSGGVEMDLVCEGITGDVIGNRVAILGVIDKGGSAVINGGGGCCTVGVVKRERVSDLVVRTEEG